MAKPIVTQSLVSDAANALKKEGIEPSIIAIQKHIGAGSFTTIKKFLDVWKEECDATLQNAPDTPAELEQKGRELTRAVWVLATQIAQQAVTQIKEETAQQLSVAEKEAIEAHEEISRLENIEVQLNKYTILKFYKHKKQPMLSPKRCAVYCNAVQQKQQNRSYVLFYVLIKY